MGQANLRGSFEDRKNSPLISNFDKMSLVEIKAFFDYPQASIFSGFVIHSEKREDFLYKIREDSFTIRREYCQRPQDAMKFDTYKKAEKTSKLVPTDCLIGLLFEHEDIFEVCFFRKP